MIILPEESYPVPSFIAFKNGAHAYAMDTRKIAEMANRPRAVARPFFTYTWRNGYGPTIATKTIAYPTSVTADCITRIRADLPHDLTTQRILIRGVIYAPDGNAGEIADLQFCSYKLVGDSNPWVVGPITLAWSDVGQDQFIIFEMVGDVPPNYRYDAAIGDTEEIVLNAYGTWTADGGSTGDAEIVHLTAEAVGHETLTPDLTVPEDLAVDYMRPGASMVWADWYTDMVQAQDLLYANDPERVINCQTHEGDYDGFQVTVTNTTYGVNLLGDYAQFWVPCLGKKYDTEQVNLLINFYTDTAISAKIQWSPDDTVSFSDAGSAITTQAGGWNREERSINVGSSDQGILIRLMGKGSTTIKTAGFGLRYYNKSIMDSIT